MLFRNDSRLVFALGLCGLAAGASAGCAQENSPLGSADGQISAWQLNSFAQAPGAFTMPTAGHYRLHDADATGAPSAVLPFKALSQGTLALRVGTADQQNANAMVRLLAGDRVLMELSLLNDTTGFIKTGAGQRGFKGQGWNNTPRDLVISWTGAGAGQTGTVSVAFDAGTDEARAAARIVSAPFMAAGAVDGLKWEVGFGTAVNRTLLASGLNLAATASPLPDFSAPDANPATQDFETPAALAGWKATRSRIALTPQRFISGAQSLRWNWSQPDAQLTFANAKAFAGLGPNSALGLWIYNANPTTDVLRGELLKGEQVVGAFWFRLNFSGWRPVGAPYALVAKGQTFDAVRFSAPPGVATGALDLDFFNTNAAAPKNPLNFAPPLRADYQQPWIFDPSLLKTPAKTVYSSADWSLNRPFIAPLAPLTAQEQSDVAALSARLLPPPVRARGGLPASALEPLRAQIAAWQIARTGDGTSGLPVVADTFNAPAQNIKITDYMKTVTSVAEALNKADQPEQIAELRAMFHLLLDHWMQSGWGEGNNQMGWLGNGYDVRQWAKTLVAMRDEMGTPARRDATLKSVAWFFGDGRELAQPTPQYASTDNLFNYHQNLAPLFLALDDKRETVQRLKALRRVYEYFLLEATSPGTNNTVNRIMAPDGTIIHHKMHNILYGSYSVPDVMRNSIDAMMKTPTFRLSPAAHRVLRTYVENNAFAAYQGQFAPNMNGRAGTPHQWNVADLAKILAFWGTPDGQQPLDREMAALYLALTPDKSDATAQQFAAQNIAPRNLSGHLALNGAVAAVQRRAGWLASMVGMQRNFNGVEVYGWLWSNNYPRYARNGALFVQTDASPVGGWKLDGWNWTYWPGATSLVRPSAELFDYYTHYGNTSPMAGGTTLGDNGIWGMNFAPPAEAGQDDVTFRKSAFFFDNRIAVLTSGISSDKNRPVVTTLYQSALDKTDAPTVVNGQSVTAFPDAKKFAANGANWLMDNRGNGYYVPAGAGELEIKRQNQQWVFMAPANLKDANDNPITNAGTNIKYRFPNMADNEKFYNPTRGDFALATLSHGVNPKNASDAYMMLVQTTPAAMSDFAGAMKNARTAPLQIVRQDSAAHIVFDRASNTTGIVCFEPITDLSGVLKSADRPCFVMVRLQGNALQISVANTDTDALTPPKPVTLALAGAWKTSGANPRVEATSANDQTTIRVSPDGNLPLQFQLAKS